MAVQHGLGRLPGAAVILPLAAGSVSSLAPPGLRLGPFTRGLTGDGATCFIALLLVCVGAQISPATVRAVGGRVLLILATATGATGAAAIAITRLAPHGLAGVTPQALVVAATCSSPALWLALASRYGRRDIDRWAGMIAATLNSCPAVPMLLVAVGVGQAGGVSARGLADAAVPLLVGVVVGRAPGAAATAGRAIGLLLVAVSFGLGCQIQVDGLGGAWLPGAALGVGVAVAKGGLVASGWRILLHEPATVGWAAGACTVAAPLVPQIAAATSPAWAGNLTQSRSELAVAVIVSSLAAPALTALADHIRTRLNRHRVLNDDHAARTGEARSDEGTRSGPAARVPS